VLYLVTLALRLLLSAVLLLAASTKLVDLSAFRSALDARPALRRFAGWFTWLVPGAEICCASALILGPTAYVATVATGAMLLAFSVMLLASGTNAFRTARMGCACFGAHRQTSQRRAIARNLLLLACACIVALNWQNSPRWGLDPASPVTGVLVCSAVAASLLLAAADRRRATRTTWQPSRRPVRARHAPPYRLARLDCPEGPSGRDALSLMDALHDGTRVLVVFVDANCPPCERLLPRLAAWQRDPRNPILVHVVASGPPKAVSALVVRHGLHNVGVQRSREVASAYGVQATPSACLVDGWGRMVDVDGRACEELAIGEAAIAALVPTSSDKPTGDLADLRRRVLVPLRADERWQLLVFTAATDDLAVELDAHLTRVARRVLTTDKMGDQRRIAEGARSIDLVLVSPTTRPVPEGCSLLIDADGALAAAAHVRTTPTAMLLDPNGQAAAAAAVGAPAVRIFTSTVLPPPELATSGPIAPRVLEGTTSMSHLSVRRG
jgi:uncharacterized membrane protein YphA (DoxX/SURF4 family)/thiol-disulfide isomerase/thioredoxin